MQTINFANVNCTSDAIVDEEHTVCGSVTDRRYQGRTIPDKKKLVLELSRDGVIEGIF
jgi:hypothetical protein